MKVPKLQNYHIVSFIFWHGIMRLSYFIGHLITALNFKEQITP